MSVRVVAKVGVDDLLDQLANEDYETLFKLVVDLDLRVADWDFTKQLIEYFKKEEEKHIVEMGQVDP